MSNSRHPDWASVEIFTAAGEQVADLPPRVWFIEGMVTAGLCIVSARKGLGKSFFALQAGAAIASGGTFLGQHAERSRVLYVPLELDRVALHERLTKMPPSPEGLDVVYSWPRGDAALELLEAAIEQGGYKVIIVDMLGGILPNDAETNSYDLSPWLLELRRVALRAGAAIVALHHATKGDSGDPVSNLMGTSAFGGQADSIIAIDRKRGESGAKIYIAGNHGRDRTIVARFDDCRWIPADEEAVDSPRLGEAEGKVLAILGAHPEGLSATVLGATMAKNPNWIRAVLSKLAARGLVIKRGAYWLSSPQQPQLAQLSATVAPVAPGLCDAKAQRNATPPRRGVAGCACAEPRSPEAAESYGLDIF
jgi:hypothetical protein